MPTSQDLAAVNGDRNLALFCDFENIALGVRDSKYADFDMRLVVQKLLVKGSIVVKKAYCDWERYKTLQESHARGGVRAHRNTACPAIG